jgi:hypothetical protein
MIILKIFILFFTMLITGELTIAAKGDWVFVAESQGVTIHSRKVVEHPEFEFRGSLIVNQPVEVIGAVLADIPSFTRWFYKCTLARKVPDRISSDLEFLLYVAIETPWPLWNRDVVYAVRTEIDITSGKITVHGKAHQDAGVSISKDHVRITDSELQWVLERLDSNRTKVTFSKWIDAGGNIGSYLSNAGCRKTVFQSLVNLGNIVSDPKYAALGEKLKREYGMEKELSYPAISCMVL